MPIEKLFAGVIFLVIGVIAIVFNKSLGKMVWLGIPSVKEMIKGENKERRFYYRARFIKFLGVIFTIVGIVFLIISLFS